MKIVALPTAGTETALLQRAWGHGRLTTKNFASRTRLATLYQDGCAKIRLPNTHTTALEAVLINTAGGLTGGDHMQWSATLSPAGKLVLTTQACERIYRSLGGPARMDTTLTVGDDAHLDWLPQETILFDSSHLERRIDINLGARSSLTAVEAVLLGRDAMGEAAINARLSDHWRIRRQGRLLHAEATRLDGLASERNGLSLLAGRRAFATILHVARDAEACQRMLSVIRATLPPDAGIAASAQGERLVIRALAQTGLALRRLIVPILVQLTGAGALPRLWHL